MSDASNIYFNPFDPEFRANPYPHYPALLEGPPRKLELFLPTTLVARYDDVTAVLRDHATFSVKRPEMPMRDHVDPFGGAATILTSDPPAHTRLRRLVSKAFTPRRVRELEPRVRAIAAQLLDEVAAKGEFEVMADLANPLPVIVIAEMLGISPGDHGQFKRWSNDLIGSFARNFASGPSPEGVAARDALRAYLARAIAARRANPADDLISALITARDEAEALSEDELLAFVVLLLLAGNETTTNLIGNGLLTLCRDRDQFERLRRNPELLSSAVEEILRFDPPVQMTMRTATAPANIGGTEIPTGGFLFVLLAAANRDPRHFSEAAKFDIARSPNEHLSFGEGIHFCLGAPLARLEGQIAIAAILERFPRLRLPEPAPTLTYRGSMALRGLSALPLAI